mmetsp:Transcript_5983/g.9484  ORF Transcript_5983/g.9484 Transcript_5983/m.9484 type:complete len:285 (+) Transcript_5983:179-1033(+)
MQVLRKFWPRAVAGHGGSRLFSAAAGPSIVTSPGKGIGQVVVIGGGAIGSLFAGRIACNKNLKDQVWLLTSWEDQASVIDRTEGLIVKESGTAGDSLLLGSVRSARSLRDILDLKSHPQHPIKLGLGSVVIIATKQAGVRRAAEQAAQFLSATRGGICVALQNGWGHMEVISAALKYVSLCLILDTLVAPRAHPQKHAHAGTMRPNPCFCRECIPEAHIWKELVWWYTLGLGILLSGFKVRSQTTCRPACSKSSVVTSNPEVFQITSRKMCPFSPGRSYVQTLR